MPGTSFGVTIALVSRIRAKLTSRSAPLCPPYLRVQGHSYSYSKAHRRHRDYLDTPGRPSGSSLDGLAEAGGRSSVSNIMHPAIAIGAAPPRILRYEEVLTGVFRCVASWVCETSIRGVWEDSQEWFSSMGSV